MTHDSLSDIWQWYYFAADYW